MSDMYAIKGSTLTALGDAIRNAKNEKKSVSWSGEFVDFTKEAVIYVPIVINHKYRLSFTVNELTDKLYDSFDIYICDYRYAPHIIPEGQTKQIDFIASRSGDNIELKNIRTFTGSYIFEELDENDNVITNTYTPLEMVDVINGFDVIPKEGLLITGNCDHRFSYNGWNWLIERCGNKITTEGITNSAQMFYYADKLTNIPFEININSDNDSNLFYNMFGTCNNLQSIPKINFIPKVHMKWQMIFANCYKLREIPDNIIDILEIDVGLKGNNSNFGCFQDTFFNCYSLREIPERFMLNFKNGEGGTYANYYSIAYGNPFRGCVSLNKLTNIWCDLCDLTSNTFSPYFFYGLDRVRDITFQTQENGIPYERNWKKQTLDLLNVGKVTSIHLIINYNSGITADKEVKDDATYQALKNDPDWFTTNINYSRYNHDSAVNTINSLPDTSAYLAANGGTNTIKFSGAAGSLTDGGAINTLTEEEIAVAAARGWTVSFV